MKQNHIMEDVEKTVEDKDERKKLLEGLLGFILSCTQVQFLTANRRCSPVRGNLMIWTDPNSLGWFFPWSVDLNRPKQTWVDLVWETGFRFCTRKHDYPTHWCDISFFPQCTWVRGLTAPPELENYKLSINLKIDFPELVQIDPTQTTSFLLRLVWFGFWEKFCWLDPAQIEVFLPGWLRVETNPAQPDSRILLLRIFEVKTQWLTFWNKFGIVCRRQLLFHHMLLLQSGLILAFGNLSKWMQMICK